MKSFKCPCCGLVNSAAAPACKRCGSPINQQVVAAPSILCTSCGVTGQPQRFYCSATPGVVLIILALSSGILSSALGSLLFVGFVIHCVYRETTKYDGCVACKKPTIIPINSPVARATLHAEK